MSRHVTWNHLHTKYPRYADWIKLISARQPEDTWSIWSMSLAQGRCQKVWYCSRSHQAGKRCKKRCHWSFAANIGKPLQPLQTDFKWFQIVLCFLLLVFVMKHDHASFLIASCSVFQAGPVVPETNDHPRAIRQSTGRLTRPLAVVWLTEPISGILRDRHKDHEKMECLCSSVTFAAFVTFTSVHGCCCA